MKYTVMGFSQAGLVELGLDVVDAGILRWLVDFAGTGRMKWQVMGDVVYYLLRPGYLAREMPCLGLSSRHAARKRLLHLAEKGVLQSFAANGCLHFAFGPRYEDLVTGVTAPVTAVTALREPELPYSSSLNPSIRNKEIAEAAAAPAASSPTDSPPENGDGKKDTDPELRPLVLYYAHRHAEAPPRGRGFEPTIDWPRDMGIMKHWRASYEPAAIRQIIDAFFDWPGRSKTTLRDVYGKADTIYGVILDKANGRRK